MACPLKGSMTVHSDTEQISGIEFFYFGDRDFKLGQAYADISRILLGLSTWCCPDEKTRSRNVSDVLGSPSELVAELGLAGKVSLPSLTFSHTLSQARWGWVRVLAASSGESAGRRQCPCSPAAFQRVLQCWGGCRSPRSGARESANTAHLDGSPRPPNHLVQLSPAVGPAPGSLWKALQSQQGWWTRAR